MTGPAVVALRVGVWAFTLLVVGYTVVVGVAVARGGVDRVGPTVAALAVLLGLAVLAHVVRRRVDRRPAGARRRTR
ncbi:hypothetical protein GCM10027047_24410 [Rhodococcus aerolatus]